MDVVNTIKALIVAAFATGAWVAGIQFSVNAHSKEIQDGKADRAAIKQDQREQERKYIDVLGRIDERLKNIEKKTN